MNSRMQTAAPAENWDDDFEFSHAHERDAPHKPHNFTQPRLSVTSTHFSEDWDADGPSVMKPNTMTVLEDKKNLSGAGLRSHLQNWAESAPSTPTKRSAPQEENWDDDFEDKTDSPMQRHPNSLRPYLMTSRPRPPEEPENWDDDFENTDKNVTPMFKRTRQDDYVDSSDDEFTFGDKEEDRTVTTRSRSLMLRHSPPPPVPALPQGLHSTIEPFPGSPTVSVFSIPTTSGRNSAGHTSTSHLALLRPSVSGHSLAMLPPSPPIHRERRRLRKKSRPHHLDNNVFELVEEQRDSSPPLPPSTPERSSPALPPPVEATPNNKTPLLSRIGSVKKWGVRRKRASTGPAEVMAHELGLAHEENTPRPPNIFIPPSTGPSTSTNSNNNSTNNRSGWFFRHGGAPGSGSPPPPSTAELKHEKSMDKFRIMSNSVPMTDLPMPSTPSRKLLRRKQSRTFDPSSSSELNESSAKPSLSVTARRPTSMQVPNGKHPSGIGTAAGAGTRHASYGSSVGRTTARVFSTPTPTESVEELDHIQPQEGSRSFMGNMRRISLAGQKKHKKKESAAEIALVPPLPTTHPQAEHMQQDAHTINLLPPIELQPPSPPRTITGNHVSQSGHVNFSNGFESLIIPSSSVPTSFSPRSSPMASGRPSPKTPTSPPQSASLGRTAQSPNPIPSNASAPRRNSLGDLKIPARISQAQMGLKRDLGMVREFATSVDRLKELLSIYQQLLSEANTKLESSSPSRATSPTILNLSRTRSRIRSNTNPNSTFSDYKQFAASLNALTNKYKISWECAELLIELGSGSRSAGTPTPNVPVSAVQGEADVRKGRERAITLSGEESKPPSILPGTSSSSPNPSWRASTGRHDLSQRQLVLLRDMLSNIDSTPDDVPPVEDTSVNRHWRWGDAMSSTVTLPSEDSAPGSMERKKRRMSRLGMSGLRDMLRMLKRSHSEQQCPPPPPLPPPVPASTTSLSTESSIGSHSLHHYAHGQVPRRGSKTSTGPDSQRSVRDQPNSPYAPTPPLNHKASPRRPSLASIFRIGQKNKSTTSTGESSQDSYSENRSASRGSNMTGEDDWDRIDTAVDLDAAVRSLGVDGTATIKGKKGGHPHYLPAQGHTRRPITPIRCPESPQISLRVEASPRSLRPMRSIRLSNVEEVDDERQTRPKSRASNRPKTSPHRPPSRSQQLAAIAFGGRSGSVPDFKLSMTPENIKPLLENAKEVHMRLNECIKEMRALIDTYAPSQF
ncbi:hypothetical protein V8B97DRAFT_2111834 [Scleroderma yunnanense]